MWKCIEKIVRWGLKVICKILNKEIAEELVENCMQFVKFGIVGVSNSVVSYVLYAGSLFCLQRARIAMEWNYLIAQVISFGLSVLWSFYWNNKYVFILEEGKERSLFKSLIKTYISYSFTGLFLNSVLLSLWIQVLHMSEYIAPIINLIINVPVNFLVNKLWAFKSD